MSDSCYESEDHETGQLDDDSKWESEAWDDHNCFADDEYTSWETELGTTSKEPYDELEFGKWLWGGAFFPDVPRNLLDDDCDHATDDCMPSWETCYQTRPLNVEYIVRHPKEGEVLQEQDQHDFFFDNFTPDNDDDDDSGIHDLVLLVGSGIGGYVGLGLQVMDYIANSSDPVYLENDMNYDNGQRQRVYWDIDMNGIDRSDFPTSPCDSTAVEFRLDNQSVREDETAEFYTWARFDFELPTYGDDYCPCAGFNYYNKTTDWLLNRNVLEGQV